MPQTRRGSEWIEHATILLQGRGRDGGDGDGDGGGWMLRPMLTRAASRERASTLLAGAGAVLLLGGLCLRHRRLARYARHATRCLRFDLSPRRGFVPSVSSTALPVRLAAWEQMAASLPELNRSGRLRAAVDAMPVLDVDGLTVPQQRRARLLLSYLAHSYVHGPAVPWERLVAGSGSAKFEVIAGLPPPPDPPPPPPAVPPQLGVPWRRVSSALGMPLVLTASDTDLWNVGPVSDALAPAEAMGAFEQLVSMTGTRSERGFHALPFAIQRALSPALPALLEAPRAVARRDDSALVALCESVAAGLTEARALMDRVFDEVDTEEFYDIYRPLLAGFKGTIVPGAAASGGERSGEAAVGGAVSGGQDELAVHLVGPSAGQTAILLLIDAALGVRHGEQTAGFQSQMRGYLPARHSALLQDCCEQLARHGTVKDAAARSGAGSALASAHDAALAALAKVRAFHLRMASHYLRAALRGTGESDFRSLLNEALRSTRGAAGAAQRTP